MLDDLVAGNGARRSLEDPTMSAYMLYKLSGKLRKMDLKWQVKRWLHREHNPFGAEQKPNLNIIVTIVNTQDIATFLPWTKFEYCPDK